MQIDQQYLKQFAVPLGEKKAVEIPVHGFEPDGYTNIALDDPDETYLSVIYKDDLPDSEKYSAPEGIKDRTTLIIPKRHNKIVGEVGFRFSGLVKVDDLREWYRGKFNIEQKPIDTGSSSSE